MKEFQVRDVVCIPGDGSVMPYPTGYITKKNKTGSFMVCFESEGGNLVQPVKPERLEHREINPHEPIDPEKWRRLSDGTAVYVHPDDGSRFYWN